MKTSNNDFWTSLEKGVLMRGEKPKDGLKGVFARLIDEHPVLAVCIVIVAVVVWLKVGVPFASHLFFRVFP